MFIELIMVIRKRFKSAMGYREYRVHIQYVHSTVLYNAVYFASAGEEEEQPVNKSGARD